MLSSVRRGCRGRVHRLALVAEGDAGVVLVGRDGTPAWHVLALLAEEPQR
jgi:hypothetical protein